MFVCDKYEFNPGEVCSKIFKGTVRVFSSDPPYKDDYARFTTVPLKALSDQV